MNPNTPSAGWYADPDRPGWLRWWDGASWQDFWAPVAHQQDAAMSAPSNPVASPVPPSPPVQPATSPDRGVLADAGELGAVNPVRSAAPPSQPGADQRSPGGVQLPAGPPSDGPGGQLSEAGAGATSSTPRAVRGLVVPLALTLVALAVVATAIALVINRGDDEPAAGGDDGGGVEQPLRSDRLIDTCSRAEPVSIPGTDISVEPLPVEREVEIGAETRTIMLETFPPATDRAGQQLLDDLLDELEPAESPYDFTVTLVESDQINAFAIPGGDLFFTTAIVEFMNEEELAFVTGHEIAHVQCRHIARQFEREALAAAGISAVLGTEVDADDLYGAPTSAFLTTLASLPFSRADESEADLASLDLLEAAGRPLSAGLSALERLRSLETSEPSRLETFLSTHPPTSQRIADLEVEIADR